VIDPSNLDDQENWAGGFYELAIEIGPTDDRRLEETLTALWRIAAIEGCFVGGRAGRSGRVAVPVSLSSLETAGHLRGAVTLPGNRVSVCESSPCEKRRPGPDAQIGSSCTSLSALWPGSTREYEGFPSMIRVVQRL